MNGRWKKGIVIAVFFVFVFVAINMSGSIAYYIATVKPVTSLPAENPKQIESRVDPEKLHKNERAIYDKIVEEAAKLKIEPIDAKEDPVWKAIPALNGLEVDINRTFQSTVQNPKFDKISFVFREIPPKITLDDLGPLPIYKGNPRKPMVSLMINVAWKEENLPEMLQILKEEQVKATFFFLGSWLKDHPEEARAIAADGHELSNHAYWHRTPLSQLSESAVRKEILDTQSLIKETFGVGNRLFAPPSGDFNANTVRVAHDLGLKTILWSLDTVDWKEPPPEAIVRKVRSRLEPGSLILMHPTESAKGALRGIIQEAKRRQLAIGTVSETISPNRVPAVEP